jgi:hypothetical protein
MSPIVSRFGYASHVVDSNAVAMRPIVVCPLEFERRSLARAGLEAAFDVVCCGPGPEGVRRFGDAYPLADRTVILAGLGGGLTPTVRRGEACWITAVLDAQSRRRWRPTIITRPDEATAAVDVVACSSNATLTTVRDKAQHHAATGADVVDRESTAFAAVATDRKWSWGIVRGISDGLDDELPASVDDWVDEAGGTRLGRVLSAVAASVSAGPFLLPSLLELRVRGAAAMSAVASALRRFSAE